MRAGGGKAKGAEFERLICKRLSLWLTRGFRDDLFWRSAMSGGRASVQFKKGKRNQTQEGDISAVDPIGHRLTNRFVLECKCVRDLFILRLLEPGAMTGISTYWAVLLAIAARSRKLPLLIAKQNGGLIYMILDKRGIELLGLEGSVVAYFSSNELYFVPFDSFVQTAKRI